MTARELCTLQPAEERKARKSERVPLEPLTGGKIHLCCSKSESLLNRRTADCFRVMRDPGTNRADSSNLRDKGGSITGMFVRSLQSPRCRLRLRVDR